MLFIARNVQFYPMISRRPSIHIVTSSRIQEEPAVGFVGVVGVVAPVPAGESLALIEDK